MARRSKNSHFFAEGNLGQHIALSVAAHLARTQLVPDPLRVYDAQHLSEAIDAVANALVRVAPLYVQDPKLGAPRPLADFEREGAIAKRGATVLFLRDGRMLAAVSMKRADLRQAIAILRTIGVPGLVHRHAEDSVDTQREPDRVAQIARQLTEVENALRAPLVPERLDRTNRLLVSIARNAPRGPVANMAMRLMSAVQDARLHGAADDSQVAMLLARLRSALHEAELERART